MEIYQIFDQEPQKVYAEKSLKKLRQEDLSSVCVLQITDIGAMGAGGLVLMVKEDGSMIPLSILKVTKGPGTTHLGTNKIYDYLDKSFCPMDDIFSDDERIYQVNQKDWQSVYTGYGWYVAGRKEILDKLEAQATKEIADRLEDKSMIKDMKFDIRQHLAYCFVTLAGDVVKETYGKQEG